MLPTIPGGQSALPSPRTPSCGKAPQPSRRNAPDAHALPRAKSKSRGEAHLRRTDERENTSPWAMPSVRMDLTTATALKRPSLLETTYRAALAQPHNQVRSHQSRAATAFFCGLQAERHAADMIASTRHLKAVCAKVSHCSRTRSCIKCFYQEDDATTLYNGIRGMGL